MVVTGNMIASTISYAIIQAGFTKTFI